MHALLYRQQSFIVCVCEQKHWIWVWMRGWPHRGVNERYDSKSVLQTIAAIQSEFTRWRSANEHFVYVQVTHTLSRPLHMNWKKCKMLYAIVLLQHTLIKRFTETEAIERVRKSLVWSWNMQIVWSLEIYHPCTYFNIPDSRAKIFVDEHKTWHNWWTLMMKMMSFETVRIFVCSLNSMLYFRIL